ncbi:MULTIDRUG RESISTANCE PROTEIN [Salix koriyanagi]|uniref:MULTIDRUG RESISTANCE PROTEIN n=1 Tax=Salix koriyanagi TaxID=2511006 RepID=A0A9Q0VZ38_9ROSI|nr:MULTIDRUG RESISTANCE PROTEIN [Salix koriyanagi]
MGVKFMVHYSLELWYNTVLVLLTGNLNNAEVAINALSICLNINGWEMMISLGFLAAASVRVSNELGRGSSKAVKFSIVVTVLTSFSIGLVLFFDIPVRQRKACLHLHYKSRDMKKKTRAIREKPLAKIYGKSIVAYINIACYYLVGIPIGVVLGYVMDMHVKGVWIGMLIETFIQTVALIIVTYRTDWEKQVIVAHNQINKWFVADPEETVA